MLVLDVLWEVLLRLSTKELCRLRVVCQSWRSITSNPVFIAAHKARHPGPLLVVGLLRADPSPRAYIVVMDLSGNVVKRIHSKWGYSIMATHLDLVCISEMVLTRAVETHVLNPATGAVHALPVNLKIANSARGAWNNYTSHFSLGKVPTGEYKVLCILTEIMSCHRQIVEIITLNTSIPMQWRAKQAQPICARTGAFDRVVVKGVVYFLLRDQLNGSTNKAGIGTDWMALFDLNSEEWISSYLQGPISSHPELNDMNNMLTPHEHFRSVHLSLAELNDALVVAQYTVFSSGPSLDLWYLMDLEKHIWERKYRTRLVMNIWEYDAIPHPVVMLEDGRILICFSKGPYTDKLQIYNPKTNTWTPNLMNARNNGLVDTYSGCLLSVQNGDEL